MLGFAGDGGSRGVAGQASRGARRQRVMARSDAQRKVVVTRGRRACNYRPSTVACRNGEGLNDAVGRRVALVYVTDDPTSVQRNSSRSRQRRRQCRKHAAGNHRNGTPNHGARITQPRSATDPAKWRALHISLVLHDGRGLAYGELHGSDDWPGLTSDPRGRSHSPFPRQRCGRALWRPTTATASSPRRVNRHERDRARCRSHQAPAVSRARLASCSLQAVREMR